MKAVEKYYIINHKNQRVFIEKNQRKLFKQLGYKIFMLRFI